ncbi:hypothetical protein [Actinomyces procaprae]|uniref:hypothetical protein n=1 Tax=Actinomyces procaprae TaxID=2560010 RepID=UPI00109DFCAF|nr:hypothetical protein [Actinomyces procaprae]
MGIYHMITPPAPTPLMLIDRDSFVRQAKERWPECEVVIVNRPEAPVDACIYPVFEGYKMEVSHFTDNQAIVCRGALEAPGAAEVAAWARSLNPDPELILWLIDDDFTGHVVLTPGITPDEIRASWVDHAEHDPAVEYPEYFGN